MDLVLEYLEKQKIDIVNAEVGVDNAEDLILDNDDIILDDEDEVEIIDDVDVLEGVSTEDPVRMYLKKIGKGIPEDVQIVGIGDSVIGRMMEPPLTTVHYFYKTSGIEAANMLIGMVEEKAEAIKEIKMGYRLEKRDSVKK